MKVWTKKKELIDEFEKIIDERYLMISKNSSATKILRYYINGLKIQLQELKDSQETKLDASTKPHSFDSSPDTKLKERK